MSRPGRAQRSGRISPCAVQANDRSVAGSSPAGPAVAFRTAKPRPRWRRRQGGRTLERPARHGPPRSRRLPPRPGLARTAASCRRGRVPGAHPSVCPGHGSPHHRQELAQGHTVHRSGPFDGQEPAQDLADGEPTDALHAEEFHDLGDVAVLREDV